MNLQKIILYLKQERKERCINLKEILKVDKIQKYYGNKDNITKAIDGISFEVEEGEFIGIMGASGSGKTTLLNCISTIDHVSSGHIYLENEDITEIKEENISRFRRKNLGFIFQDFNLLDTLTIEENIALILTINKLPPKDIDRKVQDIALRLGILDFLNKYPYQVSGGQKQRAAASRAIVNSPKIILADEPTGSLDSKAAIQLLEIMKDMQTKMNATILMVTHDPLSASYCSKILFLKDGKIFNRIERGEKQRKEFYNEILDVLALLGGDTRDVR